MTSEALLKRFSDPSSVRISLHSFVKSKDGTEKYVFKMQREDIYLGQYKVEGGFQFYAEVGVIKNREDRICLCLPTFTNCSLGCLMCHLTHIEDPTPSKRILDDELLNLIITAIDHIRDRDGEEYLKDKSFLLSFMGVGEPMYNTKGLWGLLTTIKTIIATDEDSIYKRLFENMRVSIATTMPHGNLRSLSEIALDTKIPIKVHFSLISMDEKIRKHYIPSAVSMPIRDILQHLILYSETIEENLSDSPFYKLYKDHPNVRYKFAEIHYTPMFYNACSESLFGLERMLRNTRLSLKIISYNPVDGVERAMAPEKKIYQSLKSSLPNNLIEYYIPPGRSIGASCGEFDCDLYSNKKKENNG